MSRQQSQSNRPRAHRRRTSSLTLARDRFDKTLSNWKESQRPSSAHTTELLHDEAASPPAASKISGEKGPCALMEALSVSSETELSQRSIRSMSSQPSAISSEGMPMTPRSANIVANLGSSETALRAEKALPAAPFDDEDEPAEQEGALSQEELSEPFSIDRCPSESLLREAAKMTIVDEYGQSLPFEALIPHQPDWQRTASTPPPRTVIFFSGSFWCGPCQEYILHSVSHLNPDVCASANVNVVLISCGSWRLSKRFREVTNCPFTVYVDSNRSLYKLFGLKVGTMAGMMKDKPPPEEPSKITQITAGFARACRMPLGNPGSMIQLGGEFVLSEGYKCDYAHRQTSKFRHVEACEVLRHAGVPNALRVESVYEPSVNDSQLDELLELDEQMARWRARRSQRATVRQLYVPPTAPIEKQDAKAVPHSPVVQRELQIDREIPGEMGKQGFRQQASDSSETHNDTAEGDDHSVNLQTLFYRGRPYERSSVDVNNSDLHLVREEREKLEDVLLSLREERQRFEQLREQDESERRALQEERQQLEKLAEQLRSQLLPSKLNFPQPQ